MKQLHIIFACLIVLLAVCVLSPMASAHTSIYPGTSRYQTYTPYRTLGTVTSLNRSVRFPGNYVFSPTYITCRVYRSCVTVVNRTGNTVLLTNDYGRFVARLWPGATYSQTYYHPGTFYLTDWQRNIRVPLTITVMRGYSVQPRYPEQMEPMRQDWRRF